jgi:glycolate oxidase iron-sulfur subunit
MYEFLPPLKPRPERLPQLLSAQGKRRARVALFTGCVGDAVFPDTNWATARVLQHNGCDVVVPRGQTCCGALHYHCGYEKPAQDFGARNCTAFGAARVRDEFDAIIVNAAGCGSLLKDYGHLLRDTPVADAGSSFAGKVRDVSEFLVQLGPLTPSHPLPIRATYHDACHLCHAQGIREPPRQLLELIPGLELVPLHEGDLCCGAAGTYNLSEPDMARRLGERKAEKILATGARAVFAANVGCIMQISRHLGTKAPDLWVGHPVDALWASYSGNTLHTTRPG